MALGMEKTNYCGLESCSEIEESLEFRTVTD